jgi:hypothetical protein
MAMNDLNFMFFGLRRSGQHAVINWVAAHFDEPVWFFNNIKDFSNPKPISNDTDTTLQFYVRSPKTIPRVWSIPKKVLFQSYEDKPIDNLDFASNARVTGSSGKTICVIVLRDIFNMVASRLSHPNSHDLEPWLRQRWIQYAREAIGETNYLPNMVFVNYNLWFNSEPYRRDLEKKMGLRSTDKGINLVFGAGSSSFSGFKYNGKAQEMKVRERWKFYENDKNYVSFFQGVPRLWELNDALFGKIAEPLRLGAPDAISPKPRGNVKIRFVLTICSDNTPIGGVKQIYRQVDVLRKNGYDAAVIHGKENFRCSWFENDTVVVGMNDEVESGDYVVLPEVLPSVPKIKGIENSNIVVYAQNPFNVPTGFGGVSKFREFYRDRVQGVMCVSQHSVERLSSLLPENKIYRILHSLDRPPFGLSECPKEKRIAYMPRRTKGSIEAVLTIVRQTGLLEGWRIDAIDGKSEAEVAAIMQKSMIFISGSFREGFGLPPAEAMACGCVVVGWTGGGGQEFMLPGISYPVPDGDELACADALKTILSQPFDTLVETGKMASEYIRKTYSSNKEERSILEAWSGITSNSIDRKSIFPLKNVAAFVSTYDEGPYLEYALKWLSPRVGRIYVIESKTTFAEGKSLLDERMTKKIVDRVGQGGVKNISYHVIDGAPDQNPLIKEAHERNQAIEIMERDGYEWVWIVDPDEFYTDQEADQLWTWFFDVFRKHPDICGAKCSMQIYWRSMKWIINPSENYEPNIIIKSSCRIASSRHLILKQQRMMVSAPRNICTIHHYSWAHTPEYAKRKLSIWGHAKEIVPNWYNRVFMSWSPGCEIKNLHPVIPETHQKAVRAECPMPEALKDHPYNSVEVIGADRKRIKAVILNHNTSESCDRLYEQLHGCFDDVEVFDSGSDCDKIPIHMGRKLPNVYWTGGWNEILKTCSDYDAVWMLGGDIELKSSPEKYREAIEASLPFGCWSPCIDGRAKPFMQAGNYRHGQPKQVRNIEGMALALSGEVMRTVKRLPEGSNGYGQDLWLCLKAREMGLGNIIDGRVSVYHPEARGYDDKEFHDQMEAVFGKMYGPDFRRTAFQYDDRYEHNLMEDMEPRPKVQANKPFTIVTVDNGWGYPDFVRISSCLPDARKIIMTKGVAGIPTREGVDVIPYDKGLSVLLSEADAALFPKVGSATKNDLLRLMRAGVPCVIHKEFSKGLTAKYLYDTAPDAEKWLLKIRDNPELRFREISKLVRGTDGSIRVSVITPTWNRDPKIIKRCIDAMRLQTEKNWEQLICSNGTEEHQARQLVEAMNDSRVKYRHLDHSTSSTDFGNSARVAMIKEAQGEFVAFCDDDNIYLPNFLEAMLSRLTCEPDADFAVCDIMHFGPLNESEVGAPPMILKGEPVKLYHIDPLQVMVKTSVMQEAGWDVETGYLSDGVTLENLGKGHNHLKVDKLLGVHL